MTQISGSRGDGGFMGNFGRRTYIFCAVAVVLTLALAGPRQATCETLLSLEDAIDIALEEGFEMKSLRLSLLQAEQNRLAARYRFRTQVDMRLFAPSWSERISEVPVPNALPVYNNLGTMRYQGRLDISQPLPTDGTLTLRSNIYQSEESNYFAETEKTLKRKDFYSSFSLNFNQPLFTYNRLKTGLRRSELNYERQSLSLRRTRLNVIYQVTNAFFTLYRSTRAFDISAQNLSQQQDQYELARLKFEAGLIPEVEALQLEVELASAQADNFQAEANIEREREAFKLTIGLPLDSEVGVVTDIEFEPFPINLNSAIDYGLANRTELREQNIAIELQKINLTETDANSEISASLQAFYDLTGFSDPALPFDSSTRSLFDSSWNDLERRPGNRGVTLMIEVPVWDWGVNAAEVASASANLKRSEIQLEEERKTVVTSITDAVRSVGTAENSVRVFEKSQLVAERSYEISLERFNNGEITGQELAIDTTRLHTARMAWLNAYISYRLAIENLKRMTHFDFEKNAPLYTE
jgi:outer membrane protein